MKTGIQTLTENECELLLEAVRCCRPTRKSRMNGTRNYLMTLLMLDAGLRVSEVANLPKISLYFDVTPVKMIVIPAAIAKNKKQRSVPVTERIHNAILGMITMWWIMDDPKPGRFAFYVNDPSKPLTVRQIQNIIWATSLTAFSRAVHPHELRHTFATRVLRQTNIRVVQTLLGHSNLASTQIYTHPDNDDLKKAIDAMEKNQ